MISEQKLKLCAPCQKCTHAEQDCKVCYNGQPCFECPAYQLYDFLDPRCKGKGKPQFVDK